MGLPQVLKSIVLPFLTRGVMYAYSGDNEQANFAFIYGMLPCANAVLVIARGYSLAPGLMPRS